MEDFREIERALRDKEKLEEVYFEGNPVQKREPVLYRNKLRLALPQVGKIDACEFDSVFRSRCFDRSEGIVCANGIYSVCQGDLKALWAETLVNGTKVDEPCRHGLAA